MRSYISDKPPMVPTTRWMMTVRVDSVMVVIYVVTRVVCVPSHSLTLYLYLCLYPHRFVFELIDSEWVDSQRSRFERTPCAIAPMRIRHGIVRAYVIGSNLVLARNYTLIQSYSNRRVNDGDDESNDDHRHKRTTFTITVTRRRTRRRI